MVFVNTLKIPEVVNETDQFSFIQVLANFLSSPLVSGMESDAVGWPFVAFDLDPSVVKVSEVNVIRCEENSFALPSQ